MPIMGVTFIASFEVTHGGIIVGTVAPLLDNAEDWVGKHQQSCERRPLRVRIDLSEVQKIKTWILLWLLVPSHSYLFCKPTFRNLHTFLMLSFLSSKHLSVKQK